MKFMTPIPMTDATLTSSSVAEDTNPAWVVGTTYAKGALVHVASTHRVYESAQAANVGHNPATDDGTWWLDAKATNRWAMFDQGVGTSTIGTNPMTVVITPTERFGSMCFLGLVASSVRIQVVHSAVTIYDKTYTMVDKRVVTGWWEYYFLPFNGQSSLIVDDLPPTGVITVTINGTACGTLGYGLPFHSLGKTLTKPTLGIISYSTKLTDQWGVTDVVVRPNAKRYDVNVIVENNRVDAVASKLAEADAQLSFWSADDSKYYESLLIYGFYRDWSNVIAYPSHSELSISIEGIV